VLDLHRDAVQDANGTQYKLVTAEDPSAAQVSLIMGVAHDGWQGNLRLAIAVQEKLETQSPTLMRPITLLNYRYNQFVSPGAMLLEVGAAGNSLDEALYAARLFAQGFADTLQS
jgi:stage II sporulation protein P